MSDIKVGDIVIDPDGLYWRVERIEHGVIQAVRRFDNRLAMRIKRTPYGNATVWGQHLHFSKQRVDFGISVTRKIKRALLPLDSVVASDALLR